MDIQVRWRNDYKAEWEYEQTQSLDQTTSFVYLQTPGQYRARQFEISFEGDSPFAFIRAEEEVTGLVS